ncbi:MAG: class I SAM-dependent methyltransferase [Acidobacteriota bacterium]
MSWDPIWEETFANREWGRYPPEELIRFVARHFYSAAERHQVRILEIGCGPGANIWYLAREGFDAYGIDGSPTAIGKAQAYLQSEGLKGHLTVGDVSDLKQIYSESHFDAVVDVGCLVCNSLSEIASILDQAKAALKPGGRIFSMVLGAGTWGDGLGRQVEPGTFVDITEGPLVGKGLCHFFSVEEIDTLFGERFGDLQVDYIHRSCADRDQLIKHWLIEGTKLA